MMVAAGFQEAIRIVPIASLIGVYARRDLIEPGDAKPYPCDKCNTEENEAKTLWQRESCLVGSGQDFTNHD
jgi:hypothetical protein